MDPRDIARMIEPRSGDEGRWIRQITKVFTRTPDGDLLGIMVERRHRVVKFKQYLPAGPLPNGSVRQHDLIQFYADPGGLRTVVAADLIL
jgi:hypothetical protein